MLGYGKVVAAGGVAANSRIRRDLTEMCHRRRAISSIYLSSVSVAIMEP